MELLPQTLLVGGLEHDIYFSIYWEESSSQLTHIFQRGRSTTNTFLLGLGFSLLSIGVRRPGGAVLVSQMSDVASPSSHLSSRTGLQIVSK